MTVFIFEMSIPLAITEVDTSTWNSPSLNPLTMLVLSTWLLSPWMAATPKCSLHCRIWSFNSSVFALSFTKMRIYSSDTIFYKYYKSHSILSSFCLNTRALWLISAAAEPTRILIGSAHIFWHICSILVPIVAVKNRVYRSALVCSTMLPTYFSKPKLIILSASSTTKNEILSRQRPFFLTMSISLPGVATKTWTFLDLRSFQTWCMLTPLNKGNTFNPNFLNVLSKILNVCYESSAVGVKIKAMGPCSDRLWIMWLKMGMRKPIVLPDPVFDKHIKSLPAMASGIQ